MEDLIRDLADNIKRAITFLEKVKDKKLKSERDDIISKLNDCYRRCDSKINLQETYDDVGGSGAAGGEIYNDVAGENYDDVGTMPPPPAKSQEEDNVYDEGGTGEQYDDVAVRPPPGPPGGPAGIALIECEKLTHPVISDYLELKKSKTLLSSPWQKRWCVVHSGILYIYESAKDKQQKEAFDLKPYRFIVREDISKEAKRKDRCFELKSDSKIYEFCAADKECLSKWKAAVEVRGVRGRPADPTPEETYDDVAADQGSRQRNESDSSKSKKKGGLSLPLFGKKKGKASTTSLAEEENTYDDTARDTQTYQDTGADTYDDTGTDLPPPEEDGELYEGYDEEPKRGLPSLPPPNDPKQRRSSTRDELPPVPGGNSMPPGLPNRASPSIKSRHNDPLPLPPGPREEAGSASGTFHPGLPMARPPMPVPGEGANKNRSLPAPPSKVIEELGRAPSPVATPTPPPPPLSQYDSDEFSIDSTEGLDAGTAQDYENMYQGMWDCEPDEDNELRFKRGEIVHVISKVYDDYGWWVAESDADEVGLVPVSYLMKAYDI